MSIRIGHKTKKALRIGAKLGGIGLSLAGAGYLGKKNDTPTSLPTSYPEPAGATASAPPAQVIPQPSAQQGIAPQLAKAGIKAGAEVFAGEKSKVSGVKEVVKAGLHTQPKPAGENIQEMIKKAEAQAKANPTKIKKPYKSKFVGKRSGRKKK
tara:strand:+ start:1156 stop:1614 length:459 start_codon:yes stop_codon:yes gene_type:complete